MSFEKRRPVVAVIGQGGTLDEHVETLAYDVGRAVVDEGARIVCGGLGGVMAAAARGARTSAKRTGSDVIGVLPTYDASTANDAVDIVVPTGAGLARNVIVVASADAVIAIAGGSGTLSEIAIAWQLGKRVVALEPSGGWAAKMSGQPVDERRADEVIRATTSEEAVALALQ